MIDRPKSFHPCELCNSPMLEDDDWIQDESHPDTYYHTGCFIELTEASQNILRDKLTEVTNEN